MPDLTVADLDNSLSTIVGEGLINVQKQTQNSVDAAIAKLVETNALITETNSILRANTAATTALLSKLVELQGGLTRPAAGFNFDLNDVTQYVGPILAALL